MHIIVLVAVAALAGIAATLQTQALGVMTQRAGTLESTLVNYGIGGLVIVVVMLAARGGNLSGLRGMPWWVYGAGLMGLVVVAALGVSAEALGLARTVTVFTASSLILAAVIDHFGWVGAPVRSLDLVRAVGVVLLLVGTWLVVRA